MNEQLDALLADAVRAGDVPAAAVLVADRDRVIYSGAAGPRAVGSTEPFTDATPLRLASMTKMITTVAALRLVEQGRLELDAPVATYRPEFAELAVLSGFAGDAPILRPAKSAATVRQLMSHTGGLGYWVANGDLDRWEQLTGTPNILAGQRAAFAAPLVSDPGTRWEYGTNTDWLGLVVETVTGEPLDAHLRTAITDPLGMTDTTGRMSAAQRERSAPIHMRGADGQWAPTELDWPQEPEFWSGGGYLYSTPQDYLRFTRMLLRGGELDGVRILSEPSVAEAFANQIGELEFPALIRSVHPELVCDIEFGPGLAFGLGLQVHPEHRPGRRGAGSGGWWGFINSHYWIDPQFGLTVGLFCQALPFAEPSIWRLYQAVERAVYAT